MNATRVEHDSLGEMHVPAERLWGAQTQRSLENFRISNRRMPWAVVRALVLIKKAAALVNAESGALKSDRARAICQAADEVLRGEHDDEFPLVVWQTGSGTQTNMNVNEVLANRASVLFGGGLGDGRLIHPNDDVNLGQSSNDAFSSAMALAATESLRQRLEPAVAALRDTLLEKAAAFSDIVKLGRTHLMDATPLTLGQEIGGWAHQLTQALAHLEASHAHVAELAIGGTAVGTGLNAPAGFAEAMSRQLSHLSGHVCPSATNKFEALAAHDGIVFAHAAVKTLAVALVKIANDVRWLASGPRAGLGEIRIPENEPGSSIMPGKINPTQAEALLMVCARVFGNDVTISFAGASGNFELNTFKPVIIDAFLESTDLLSDAVASFHRHAAAGIEPNKDRIHELLERSLMLVTALTPHIGYEAAARIARKAHEDGSTLRTAALALGLVSAADFERWVRPELMLGTTTPVG